ncbi:MAG TPA: hypothetical protein DCZ11_07055 [Gammaproteobacteria bacterium]|nr:hypothetical protein [Gammaproteobacteria bacterium]MCH78184.1 hypothetical protein [Gammaproteobacteria bacterium]
MEAYRQILASSLAVPVLPFPGAELAMRHEPSRPAPWPDPQHRQPSEEAFVSTKLVDLLPCRPGAEIRYRAEHEEGDRRADQRASRCILAPDLLASI